MYFLLDACQHPAVLRTIYFGTIIRDIVFTIIPIGIVLMTIVDFSKGLIAGKEDEQQKAVKLIPKRLMYAIIVFAIPWVVHILMKTLSNLKLNVATNYQLCIDNAKSGAETSFSYYDNLLEEEEQAEKERLESLKLSKQLNDTSNFSNHGATNIVSNLWQSDYSDVTKDKVCGGFQDNGKPKTIASSGCGYMSYTMVVRSFGYSEVTPNDIVSIACNEYGYKEGPASYGFLTSDILNNRFKLRVDTIVNETSADPNKGKKYIDSVRQALKEGKKLIILMPGHYISIIGINSNNTIVVRDSARGYASDDKYTVESLYETTKNPKNDCKTLCGWTMILAYSKK